MSDSAPDLELPGGVAGLTSAVGVNSTPPRSYAVLDIIRLVYGEPENPQKSVAAGRRLDLLRRYLVTLRQYTDAGGAYVPAETVPLPLPARIWSAAVFRRTVPARHLAVTILSDRRASLLYYGLAALDEPTLAFLAEHPAVISQLYDAPQPLFATCGRSLHVRDGRVLTPGPASAERLWEALAGERPDRPDQFITKLFSRDEGRLALFYDLVAHLDGPRQRYALGARIADEEARRAQLRALYAAYVGELRAWNPADRPFQRVAFDAAQLLSSIAVTPDGALAPAWSRVLAAVFEDTALPEAGVGVSRPLESRDPPTAAALVKMTGGLDVTIRRERFETVLFGQRVFAAADASAAPDILVALRGFVRFGALMLTLERMGVTDPALMARAARQAERLSGFDDPATTAVLLAQFQGALTIVERARFARVIDADAARELAGALIDFAPVVPAHFARQMTRWLDERLLPELTKATVGPGAGESSERVVLMAMAGAHTAESPAASAPPDRIVRWEEQDYRVDPGQAELRRLGRLRAKQPSNDLDAVLEFARAIGTLASSVRSLAELSPALDALRIVEPRLRPPVRVGLPFVNPGPDAVRTIDSALRDALTIKTDADLRLTGLGKVTTPLYEYAALLFADVLSTLAYLPSLGDPDGPTLLAGNIAARHDFGLSGERLGQRARLAWRLATEVSGAGVLWHMDGSLLGLDVALSNLALRQMASERVPPVPALDINDRAMLAAAVVLTNPHDVGDTESTMIAGAIGAGRDRVEKNRTAPAELGAMLADVGADEWRVRAAEWLATRDPERVPDLLSLADLFWLGAGATGEAATLDAFGPAMATTSACLCTRFPAPQSWDVGTGREGAGFLTSRFGDLKLRIVETLAELKLPAALLPGVLAVATPDFISEAAPVHRDDWLTLARQVQRIPKSRFEDYIATLTASGPLVPIEAQKRFPTPQ